MTEAARETRVALAGSPNCGKTALFNALTGSRQKVANYAGVTVEKKEGTARTPSGRAIRVLDLPGAYSLAAQTPDEEVTRDVLTERFKGEAAPDVIVAVADATNLERNLGFVLELKELGKPVVLALNMMDLARGRKIDLDVGVLSREIGLPIVETVAVKRQGLEGLLTQVDRLADTVPRAATAPAAASSESVRARFAEVDRLLGSALKRPTEPARWTERLDRVLLHPVAGSLVLIGVLAFVFQAIFTWAEAPMGWIESGLGAASALVSGALPEGALRSLIAEGVIPGVGAVLVFLPQIVILFGFILLMEDSGYLARAAFLMDKLMGKVGLHGRAFIPLLSSYACAIPGIMATRTIENRRDRLTTILVAPLTTCSARLPVYALLIGAFIPARPLAGPVTLQGAVMFGLYLVGAVSALAVAFLLKKTILRGPEPSLFLELPTYKMPSLRNLAIGLFERSKIFVRRAGTVILSLSILIWFLASYPKAPEGATGPAISYSYAGRMGRAIEPFFRPLGYDWRISTGMVPGFAAREVMVGALATVYAVESASGDEEETAASLGEKIAAGWSLATALSLLMFYVFAPQCLSTLAVTRRETNSWRWPIFMLVYLTAFAYLAAFMTYRLALLAGLG